MCYVSTAPALWILTHSFYLGGERQSSVISHRCFITEDVTPDSPLLIHPRTVACVICGHVHHDYALAWHMTLPPHQYNPVTVFSMLFRNLVTPWKGHTHTEHIPCHSIMHEQSDMTPCVSLVTPLQCSRAVNNTHHHP